MGGSVLSASEASTESVDQADQESPFEIGGGDRLALSILGHGQGQ